MYSFLKNNLTFCKLSSIMIGNAGKIYFEDDSNCIDFDDHLSSARRAIMPATRELVDQYIASDKVVIFSKTWCPYCKIAKQVFDSLKEKYTAIELDDREDANEIQSILGEMTGAKTMPRVFVKGVCLGGGSDVQKLYSEGELQKKL